MVKPSSSSSSDHHQRQSSERNDQKYKGVRKRKWGKWVSEIRLPNSRERIWLGSYDSPEKAARAFDAALFCLRGNTATFNFPDNPPDIPGGRSLTPAEIQAAASNFANSGSAPPTRRGHSDNSSYSSSTQDHRHQAESPSNSVSEGTVNSVNTLTETTAIDPSFLDHFSTLGSSSDHTQHNSTVPNNYYEIFPGFDDHFSNDFYNMPSPLPNYTDYNAEENYDGIFTQEPSFLWNFER